MKKKCEFSHICKSNINQIYQGIYQYLNTNKSYNKIYLS